MSYILDALKKANAERERERWITPGLHTLPPRKVADSSAQSRLALTKNHAILLALSAALVLCMVTIGALFWSPSPPPAVMPSSHSPTLQQLETPQNNTTTAPITPQANAQTATATTSTANELVTTVPVKPAPGNLSRPAVKAQPQPSTTTSENARLPPPTARPKPAPAQTKQAISPALSNSPRAELPPLAISGSTYSDNPAHRMLIINGQVYREGESPAPELKLEQIRLKSAVLIYKGSTYVLNY